MRVAHFAAPNPKRSVAPHRARTSEQVAPAGRPGLQLLTWHSPGIRAQ